MLIKKSVKALVAIPKSKRPRARSAWSQLPNSWPMQAVTGFMASLWLLCLTKYGHSRKYEIKFTTWNICSSTDVAGGYFTFLLCKFQIFLKFIHDTGSSRFVNLIIYKIFVRKPKFSFYFHSLTLYLCRVFNWMRAGFGKNLLKALETVKKDFCHNLFWDIWSLLAKFYTSPIDQQNTSKALPFNCVTNYK